MSLLVTGIRLPFDEPETAALDRARRLTGLLSSETEAAVCRVSIDARRGQISRVYSVRLDAPCEEKAFAEKLQIQEWILFPVPLPDIGLPSRFSSEYPQFPHESLFLL